MRKTQTEIYKERDREIYIQREKEIEKIKTKKNKC